MIPTRVLLQAAAVEHHTPLIRFLGKRSPTSMFTRPAVPPPNVPLRPLHSHPALKPVGVKESFRNTISNHWGNLLPQNLPTQPRRHILPHPPTPCPTHLFNTGPKRKITGPSAVIVPAPPPPLLHQRHHHQPHLSHMLAP